jgi:DNA (cytosine-5)-methyltransferase 1
MAVGKHRLFLEELIAAFDELGYRILLPWKVLDASFFGVPQNRERLILIGARRGSPLAEYLETITRPARVAKFSAFNYPKGHLTLLRRLQRFARF